MRTVWKVLIAVVTIGVIIPSAYFTLGPILDPGWNYPDVIEKLQIYSDKELRKSSNCGSGTTNDPYIIENRIFGVYSAGVKNHYIGVDIAYTTKHFTIRNCTFYGGLEALRISCIANETCKIINNHFYHIAQAEWDNFKGNSGILITRSNGLILKCNEFSATSNDGAPPVRISCSNNVTVDRNKVNDYVLGERIFLDISCSNSIKISNNIILSDSAGIEFSGCSNVKIENNVIWSYSTGIRLGSCCDVTIAHNTINMWGSYDISRAILVGDSCYVNEIENEINDETQRDSN